MITTTLLMVAATHVGRKPNLPFCVNVSGEATFPSRFLLKVWHDEQNAIDEAVAGAFAFRQLTKYLLLDGSDY